MKLPTNLTEEEETLLKAYAKLKKKKKALAALKAPKPEQAPINVPEKRKHTDDPGSAMQEAKNLVKCGIIRIDSKDKDKQGFKRSKNFERKLQDPEKLNTSLTFQPFSSIHEEEDDRPSHRNSRPRGELYGNFVRSEDGERREPPKKGNTIYIHGHGINEEILRKTASNYGDILNINIEPEKQCGFVTFENMKSADEAISQMNGQMVSGVAIRVSMARRQPNFQQSEDASNKDWSSIAANVSQKSSIKDKREMVSYEAEDEMFG